MSKLISMTEGGQTIGRIKTQVISAIKAGVTPLEIDHLVEDLIQKAGDRPSFKMVSGYHHSTCINVNSGIVHGIPTDKPFKPGDLVKVDMGLYHQGYHLDTAITVQIEPKESKVTHFIEVGKQALKNAIDQARFGNSVFDISSAMQSTVEAAGYSVVRDLTGHGVGKELHMEPYIPCFADLKNRKDKLSIGQTIAIEVMYAMGDYHLVEDADGWTLSSQDGSLTGMIEESVYVGEKGPIILTQAI